MPLSIRAFPLHDHFEADLTEFASTLAGPRKHETNAFYETYGIHRETWALQRIGGEPWVIGVTQIEGDLNVAAARYAAADDPFSRWFKDKVRALSTVDPNVEPLGPPSRVVFDWRPDHVTASANLAIAPPAAE